MLSGRYHSYLNTAVAILKEYRGEQPFSEFSKLFFSRDKKYGSTDRKMISHLCYCYFRLGKSMMNKDTEERIINALFLCSDGPNKILEMLNPDLDALAASSLEEKFSKLNIDYSDRIFPWQEELSEGIDFKQFNESFLVQPDLFLRIRPGMEKIVMEKLQKSGLEFKISNSCVSLPNGSKIQDVLVLNKEAVVQDLNSQRIGELVQSCNLAVRQLAAGKTPMVWDCCAASGGKSIMVKDILGDIDLVVSDIRPSILFNLEKRFHEAGIRNYKTAVVDLAAPTFDFQFSAFDFIIADVPCTGSGTWGRTPEQLFFFEVKQIEVYAQKQKKIVSNIIPVLKPGGYLLYSTCSVFRKENEAIAASIEEQGMKLVDMQMLRGYDKKADTLFAVLFQKI